MSTFGKSFIAAAVQSGKAADWLAHGEIAHLFKPSEAELHAFVHDHVRKYGALPQAQTIAQHLAEELAPAAGLEPAGYYLDLMQLRYVEQELKRGMKAAADKLGLVGKDPNAALALLAETVMSLAAKRGQRQVSDFRDAYDEVVGDYVAKYTADDGAGLRLGWPTVDTMTGGLARGDLCSFVGRPAAGKALAHGTPVLLADGRFKPIEQMQIGDTVASVDGAPSAVFGVYPQGMRAAFRVVFGDGRSLDVDAEHLWQVGCKYWEHPRIMTTREIMRFRAKAKRYADTLYVPLSDGKAGFTDPTIDPYLLGVLLGDGGLTTGASITCADPAILERVEAALPPMYFLSDDVSGSRAREVRIVQAAPEGRNPKNLVIAALKALGVFGVKSEAKSLPSVVFAWRRADRVSLLQGLMDTDGTVDDKGAVAFGASSPRLVSDVQRLVRSLGGMATTQKPKKTTHLDHHRISVSLPDRSEAFHLSRKKARCRVYATRDPRRLCIVAVTPIDDAHCTCIAVTHPSRLFVAGDYVVTHNTMQMLYAAHHGWRQQGRCQMFVSMEMKPLAIKQRLAAMHAAVPAMKLKNAELSSGYLGKMKASLLEVKGAAAAFWVVDGNFAATVEDIWMLARQLKPDGIWVDGGYLVKHPRERDRFKRVAENADLMKQELSDLAPTMVSWQFAKPKEKSKKVTFSLDDIGYTDAIAQVSSLVLGLLAPDSVETLRSREVDILKGRNGEVGKFRTRWDFVGMDFDELQDTPVADLQYV